MAIVSKLEDNAIITGMLGKTGNNLFEIANSYCLSRETNRPFYLYLVDPVNKSLKNDALDIFNRFNYFYDRKLTNGSILINQPGNQEFFDAKIYMKDENKKYYILGYFQDEKYFEKYKEEIKNIFSCPDFLKDAILKKYGNLFDYVSIHVRRGDYVDIGNLVPDDYYEKAYHYFFEGRKCIIFSDDIEWCKEKIKIPNAIFCDCDEKYNPVLFDLYAGSFCRDHIITNSTFAWWQAYLGEYGGNSLVVSPSNWYICDYWKDIKANIVPDRWIKFDSNAL